MEAEEEMRELLHYRTTLHYLPHLFAVFCSVCCVRK